MFASWWRRLRSKSRVYSAPRPRPVGRPRAIRLEIEGLEQRLAPATLLVNATNSFLTKLQAANPGDTVQIEPNGILGDVQTSSAAIVGGAAAGDTSITCNQLFTPGQVVTITTGFEVDTALVDAVAGGPLDYLLSLQSPLQFAHPSGTIAPVANTIGIGNAVTIQGDPAHPAAGLLNGLTLRYFPQNGTPGADVLHNLSLTAVSGSPSGNLSVTGDQFNTASGMIDPVNVVSGGSLTIAGDTFSIGSSASLSSVIACGSVAGAMNLTNDTITAASNLSSDGILLFGGSGPVTFSGDKLTADGTVGGGIVVVTGGAVSVSSTTLNLDGAVTNSGLEIKSAACTLSNVTINAGATVGANGLLVNAGGDLVMSGANTVTVTGAVTTDGVDITGSASANVSNITVDLKSNVGGDALALTPSGAVTLTGASVTVGGNAGGDGIDLGLANDTSGTMTITNVTVVLDGAANYGLSAVAGGNLSVSGTQSVTVTGAVTQDGAYLYSKYGAISVSTSVGVKLGSTASYGLYVYASDGNVTMTGAVQVQVSGAVSSTGVYVESDGSTVIHAVTVTLKDTTEYGVDLEGTTLTLNGPINVNISDTVQDDGAYLRAYDGDLDVVGSITVTLRSGTDYGLYVDSTKGGLSDTGAISVNVAGNCMGSGGGIYAGGSITLSGTINVTVGGSAFGGLEIESAVSNPSPPPSFFGGSVTDTAGITVQVTGAVTDDGVYVYGTESATVANVKVKLADVAGGTGFYAEADYGPLNISAVNITANAGTAKAYGAYLKAREALNASGISVSMTGQADYGLYATVSAAASLSAVNINVSAAVANDGIYVDSSSTLTLAGLTATLQGTAAAGMDLVGYGVNVNGPLSATVGGVVTGEGIYLENDNGAMSITSAISVNLGAAAGDGVYLYDTSGNLVDSANITVHIAGTVSGAGAYLYALDNESLAGNITVTLAGAATYGLEAENGYGTLTNSGAITISIAGQVSDAGAYISGNTQTTLTNINVTLAHGSTADGIDVYGNYGKLSVSNLTLKVTGAVMDNGLFLYSSSNNISTSTINVNLSSTAGSGIYADAAYGSLTMAGTTLTVGGDLTKDGIDLSANSAITVSGMTATLKGASSYGLDADAAFSALTVTGLTLNETGTATNDGASFASGAANVSVMNSSITLGQGAAGDALYAGASHGDVAVTGVGLNCSADVGGDGFDLSSQGSTTVANNSLALNGGVNVDALQVSSSGNATINKNTISVKAGSAVGITTAVAGSLVLSNNNVNLVQQGTAAELNVTSGNPQTIIGNTFDSDGGIGIAFSGGAGVVALVQANNFQGNLIGVHITGDGQSAGDIDLGGGDLGSTGGNNFKGFNGVSGHYAIVLTNTNGTSTVFAVGNLFSVSHPTDVIQDGTINSNGVGTGVINVGA